MGFCLSVFAQNKKKQPHAVNQMPCPLLASVWQVAESGCKKAQFTSAETGLSYCPSTPRPPPARTRAGESTWV